MKIFYFIPISELQSSLIVLYLTHNKGRLYAEDIIMNNLINVEERMKLVRSMEFIARQINDEDVFEAWLCDGVADGDIPYGDFDIVDASVRYYTEDEVFAELIDTFMYCMARARRSGGLYCDDVCAGEREQK